MGRVLPSGKVFGEAVALPQIGFAKKEPFGGRIQEVAESPLTSMAVAGISRIKDELDYQDRLQAEKGRVAGQQIAVNKAQQRLDAIRQAQEEAAAQAAAPQPQAPALPPLRMPDLTGVVSEGDAFWRASQENVGPERTAEMQAQMREFTDSELEGVASQYSKMADGIIPIPAGGMMVRDPAGARLAASAFGEEIARRRSMGRLETMRGVGEELDQFSALGREMSDAATQMRAEHPLSGKSDEELAGMYDRMQRLREFRETPEHGELWRAHGDVSQISPQFEEMENNILAELARRQSPQSMIAEREVEPGLQSELVFSEEGVGPVVRGQGEVADIEIAEVVREQPAPEPVEKRDFAQEIKDAEAKLAEARSSVTPMQFVPRTMADHRFKIRELGRDLTNAQTPEEKQAVADQLRAAMQDARGAVDVQPKDLMEAITGAAGKRAQKKAFDEMTGAEKAFTKQMHDAAKEKREAELHAEKLTVWKGKADKARRRMEARAGRGSGRSRTSNQHQVNWTTGYADYKRKEGQYSDAAVARRHGIQGNLPGDKILIRAKREEDWKRATGKHAKDTPASFPLSVGKRGARDAKDAAKGVVADIELRRAPAEAAAKTEQTIAKEGRAQQAKKDLEVFKAGLRQKREMSPAQRKNLTLSVLNAVANGAIDLKDDEAEGLVTSLVSDLAQSTQPAQPATKGGQGSTLNADIVQKMMDEVNK